MRAKILSPTLENISLAASAIQQGEVIGMPTETVYGLAGDCRNPLAVTRIFETKERPTFDPLIVHVSPRGNTIEELARLRLIDLSQISPQVQERASQLIQRFWPGPLTLVLPKHAHISDLVTSGLPSIALRMPQHPIAQALIEETQTALAAPSANRFGRISPTTAEAVAEELGDRIDWILNGGPSQIGVESTVIRFNFEGDIVLLRHGGTPVEAIEKLLLCRVHTQTQPRYPAANSSSSQKQGQKQGLMSPGTLESHYAPKKPLRLLPKKVFEMSLPDLSPFTQYLGNLPQDASVGLLLMSGDSQTSTQRFSELIDFPVEAISLSLSGDISETARNLFAGMRYLDSSPVSLIFSEPCLNRSGLGYAITDRLQRASAHS